MMDDKERERERETGLCRHREGERVQLVSDIAASQLWVVSVSRQLSVSDQILLLHSKRLTAGPPIAPPTRTTPPCHWFPRRLQTSPEPTLKCLVSSVCVCHCEADK